jgi:Zinc knuckle
MELEDERNKIVSIAVRENELAMASFLIAFVTKKAMNIIHAACTENWPDRETHLVVHKLMKKYRLLVTVSKIELRQQLLKIKMKKGMNPTVVFETLTAIQNQYFGPGKKMPQSKLIAIILDVATEVYRPILSLESKMKGKMLTDDNLENAMMEKYCQLTRNQSKPSGMEGESLLFGQGMCYTCGSSAHQADECPKRKDGTSNQGKSYHFQYKCNNCGNKGHKSRDGWNKRIKTNFLQIGKRKRQRK